MKLYGGSMTLDSIRKNYTDMFRAEKRVADYVLEHPQEVVELNIAEVARRSETSDATVIRMCRHVGYEGFYQMKISLAADLLGKKRDEKEQGNGIGKFFEILSRNVNDVAKNIDQETVNKCVDILANAKMVYLTAWGNTGEIAADFAHRLTRLGIRSFVSDVPEYTIRSLGLVEKGDVLVAISHSGESTHVIQALQLAKEVGTETILITDASQSDAAREAQHVLCTDSKEHLFKDLGGASHMMELMMVDVLLYLLQGRETMTVKGDKTEFLLSRYKQ